MPEPTKKSPELEEELVGLLGYDRRAAIRESQCAPAPQGCGRVISDAEFDSWDPQTKAEYRITGLCDTCQDEVFGAFDR